MLLLTCATLLKLPGFAGEDGFNALQVVDIELAGAVVVVESLDLFSADTLNQALLECLLRAGLITVTKNTLAGCIMEIEG